MEQPTFYKTTVCFEKKSEKLLSSAKFSNIALLSSVENANLGLSANYLSLKHLNANIAQPMVKTIQNTESSFNFCFSQLFFGVPLFNQPYSQVASGLAAKKNFDAGFVKYA